MLLDHQWGARLLKKKSNKFPGSRRRFLNGIERGGKQRYGW